MTFHCLFSKSWNTIPVAQNSCVRLYPVTTGVPLEQVQFLLNLIGYCLKQSFSSYSKRVHMPKAYCGFTLIENKLDHFADVLAPGKAV